MKKMKYTSLWFVLLFAGLSSGMLQGQTRQTLEANKKKIEQEIEETSRMLNQTTRNKKASLVELQLLNRNIGQRQQLIKNYQAGIGDAQRQIERLSASVARLSSDIEKLKKDYGAMIVSSFYHKDAYRKIMFIFSSKDFNQAMRRITYFRQYSDYQKKQVELIVAKQTALQENMAALDVQKKDKELMMQKEQKEQEKLQGEQQRKNQVVAQLKKQEKDLNKNLQAKKAKRAELDSKIRRIIEEEIRKSNEAAKKKAESEGKKPASVSQGTYALTPEEQTLSGNFENNRGRLPWPTERGSISGYFGQHEHPVLKGVVVNNNGIDIITPQGATARAVYDGTVSNVVNLYNLKFVMVRHGAYTTVYSNLDQVYVKTGDKVKTKQALGRIYTNADEGKTELQFQVWKGTTKLNPGSWISGGN